jgi:hypothetical protein
MRCIYLSLLACLLPVYMAVAQDNAKTPEAKKAAADEKTIRALIGQLSDDAFSVREAAHKRLAVLGEPALKLFQRAAKENPDAEVRERLGQLIHAITNSFFVEVCTTIGTITGARVWP